MDLLDQELTERIIAGAFKVHGNLGSGFLEKVYQNALAIELRKRGLKVECQVPITVRYADQPVGEYFADLVVENTIICELKAVNQLTPEHEAQLVNYLTATGFDTGLLLNFGKSVMVRRKFRKYRKSGAIESIPE